MSIVPVEAGGHVYGFDVTAIKEILGRPPVTPVPFAPEWVAGLAAVRGEIVPLISLERRLDLPPSALSGDAQHLVLLEAPDHALFGVLVDRIGSVRPIQDDRMGLGRHVCERGRVTLEGVEITILDPAALMGKT